MFPSKDVSPRWGMDLSVLFAAALQHWYGNWRTADIQQMNESISSLPDQNWTPLLEYCSCLKLTTHESVNSSTYSQTRSLTPIPPTQGTKRGNSCNPSLLISDGSTKPAIFASLSLESTSALIWPLTSLSYAMVAVSNFRTWVYLGERLKIKQASDSSKEWKGPWQKAEGAQRTMWLTFCLKEMTVLSQKSW